jgi:hypothetical protein
LAIAYFGEKGEDFKIFEAIAAKHEDITFYHSFDKNYIQLNNQVRVTIFKKFSDGKVDFLQPFDLETLDKFVMLNR